MYIGVHNWSHVPTHVGHVPTHVGNGEFDNCIISLITDHSRTFNVIT